MESRPRSPLSLLGPQEVLGERSLLHSHFRPGNISCLAPPPVSMAQTVTIARTSHWFTSPFSPVGNGWQAPYGAPPPALRPGQPPELLLRLLPPGRPLLPLLLGLQLLRSDCCLFCSCSRCSVPSLPPTAPGSCCPLAGPPSFPSAPLTPLRASCLHFPRGPFNSCCCFSASAAPALTSAFCRLLSSLLPPLRPLPSSFPVLRPPPLPLPRPRLLLFSRCRFLLRFSLLFLPPPPPLPLLLPPRPLLLLLLVSPRRRLLLLLFLPLGFDRR